MPTKPQDKTELNRQLTQLLIEHEGICITLIRPAAYVTDNMGGVKPANDTVAAKATRQRYFSGKTYPQGPSEVFHEHGEKLANSRVLIGLHDDDIQENDYFVVDDEEWVVDWVDHDRSYQTRAEVSRRAS